MKITCSQMEVLISFYIEGDLSSALKKQVEEHLEKCSSCRAKYEIYKSMIDNLKTSVKESVKIEQGNLSKVQESPQYNIFRDNLSAYLDNELSNEENIKIKKFTISNKNARKDLEDIYHLRRLMNESFNKTKYDIKQDFSKKIMKELKPKDEYIYTFNPVLKVAVAFIITVLVITSIVLFSLTI